MIKHILLILTLGSFMAHAQEVLTPEKISETVEATADGKTYKVSDVKIKA